MILAIDFDGTIVTDKHPEIGEPIPGAVETIKKLKSEGYQLILWTCRTGKHYLEAIEWCARQGISFDEFNQNLKSEILRYHGSDPRKIGADLYIDDRGILPLPSWNEIYNLVHERVPTYVDMVIREGYL